MRWMALPAIDRCEARAQFLGATCLGTGGVVLQQEKNDCGPAALCTFLDHLRIPYRKSWVYGLLPRKDTGVTMLALKQAAIRIGVRVTGLRLDPSRLRGVPVPLLAAVEGDHFVVITRVDEWGCVEVADPAIGLVRFPFDQFRRIWQGECLLVASGQLRAAA